MASIIRTDTRLARRADRGLRKLHTSTTIEPPLPSPSRSRCRFGDFAPKLRTGTLQPDLLVKARRNNASKTVPVTCLSARSYKSPV